MVQGVQGPRMFCSDQGNCCIESQVRATLIAANDIRKVPNSVKQHQENRFVLSRKLEKIDVPSFCCICCICIICICCIIMGFIMEPQPALQSLQPQPVPQGLQPQPALQPSMPPTLAMAKTAARWKDVS